jgi:hypothetical protein
MRKVLLGLLAVVLLAAGIVVFSCNGDHHGRRYIVLGTFTKRPAGISTLVTVEVRDAYTGLPIDGATVWRSSGVTVADSTTTNAAGIATLTIGAGDYTISAGKAGYSIQTFHNVDSMVVRFALEPIPTSTGDYVQITAAVTNCVDASQCYVEVITNQYGLAGRQTSGTPTSGTFTGNFYVRKGLPFYVAAYQTGGVTNEYVTRLHVYQVLPLSTDTALPFILQPITPATSTGTISGATSYTNYNIQTLQYIDGWNLLITAMAGGSLTGGAAGYSATYPLNTNMAAVATFNGGGQSLAWTAYAPGPTFPDADLSGDLNSPFNMTWPVNGTDDLTPTVSWTGGPLNPTRGFYSLSMEDSQDLGGGRPTYRAWTAFLPYNVNTFEFPEVPAALASWGFVDAQSHNLDLTALILPGFDFDNGDFTSWLYFPRSAQRVEIDSSYTP